MTFLQKLNSIFPKKSIWYVGKKCLNILKYGTINIMKDYTVNQIIIPFLNVKLGITSKILVLLIIGFL